MERYSLIKDKQPREIVLLRGAGCVYKRCTFCDYHTDCDQDTAANFRLNQAVLDRVTGLFGELEVINSGSVFELDVRSTVAKIFARKRFETRVTSCIYSLLVLYYMMSSSIFGRRGKSRK